MNHKTTKAHFAYYRKRFLYWANQFSLNEWEWEFKHEDDNSNMSWVTFSTENRWAVVGLGAHWEATRPTEEEIDECALHEALEMLMAPTTCLSRERFLSELQLKEATHAAIRRLEHFILGVDRK